MKVLLWRWLVNVLEDLVSQGNQVNQFDLMHLVLPALRLGREDQGHPDIL